MMCKFNERDTLMAREQLLMPLWSDVCTVQCAVCSVQCAVCTAAYPTPAWVPVHVCYHYLVHQGLASIMIHTDGIEHADTAYVSW